MKRFVSILAALVVTMIANNLNAQIDFGLSEGMVSDVVEPETPWSGSFAAGAIGKSGNSENLDINMTLNADRETEQNKTSLLASYFYSTNAIATVTDRFFGQARRERNLRNPRWCIYYQVQYEWDRFKDFDYRVALHGGICFEVYKLDDRFLKLRFGGGASREFGIPGAEWIPELQFGADWERQVTDSFKLFATFDYYPNVNDFSDFRFVTNAGLEFVVDEARNINFRMFVLDRFDSTPPAGNKDNDIDYGIALVLGF